MLKLMQKILALVPELKKDFYISAVLKVIESIFAGAPYGFMLLALHDLFNASLTQDRILYYFFGLLVSYSLQGILLYFFNRKAYVLGCLLSEKLRLMIGEHSSKLPMSYFNEKSIGHLNSLVADDLLPVSHIPSLAFPQYVMVIVMSMVFGVFLIFIDIQLALITLLVIPLSIPLFSLGQRIMKKNAKSRSNSLITVNSKVVEYIQGMEVVKAYKAKDYFAGFEQSIKQFKDENLKNATKPVAVFSGFLAILDVGFILTLMAGTYFFLSGEITLFVMLTFLILGLRIYDPIKSLSFIFALVRLSDVTVDRIHQLINTKPLPETDTGKVPKNMDISFKNVSFAYQTEAVLEDISFTIPEKKVTAIIGPSGAGKTTVTDLITRYWEVDSGAITIGGYDIRKIHTEVLLSLISRVFQDVYLFNDTIYHNIAFGSKEASKEAVIEAAKTAQCHEFISGLPNGYETIVGEAGATLSSGEKQRISIARAILKDAPIILLDEITASVDPENEQLIQQATNALGRSKTVVIIAHRLSTIVEADQILVVNNKGIEAAGTHDELLNSSALYQRFWERQKLEREWKINNK